ncbi:hypothetical protein L6164_002051 [Bauhinia variegata]|uniref:Uncharacterized protein n=1 Tax=Bauhinia variegata TaxID=167791 RepID=A0ACB9PX02_BAUVA|nr:hypothetical protein L6164_002051 [Bauhinia variegata]
MSTKKSTPDHIRNQQGSNISLLDLPESAMVSILSHLLPIDLCIMSQVCTSLRARCRSGNLWARLIKQKWGRVIGEVAYKEWQNHLTKPKKEKLLNQHIQNGSLGSIGGVWPNICFGSFLEDFGYLSCSRKNNSMMFMYSSLESGKFWFPAQIYRGFMLVNALLSYDSKTDKFRARHQYRGWQFLGKSFTWDTVRLPPVETPPYVLHVSDCVDELKPGDHIEIQCRVNREMPYGTFELSKLLFHKGKLSHASSLVKLKNHCLEK